MSAAGAAWTDRLRIAYLDACRAELRALKPGNVHDFAPGHRMAVADFEESARVSAPHLAAPGAPLGARVERAMSATMAAVGQNTNLGILLLCAPIAVAAERTGPAGPGDLRAALAEVLGATTVADAVSVFAAIRLASPGGLGSAAEEDVTSAPTVTLTAAMALAADRDRIARQYVTTFADVFEIGFEARRLAIGRGLDPAAVTLATYWAFASELPDTHVSRKHGRDRAEAVRRRFAELRHLAADTDRDALAAFDRELKSAGVNPGTSADLTVATEYLGRVIVLK